MLGQVGLGKLAHWRFGWDVGVGAEGDWNGCALAGLDGAPGSSFKVVKEPDGIVATESDRVRILLHLREVLVAESAVIAYPSWVRLGDWVFSAGDSGVATHRCHHLGRFSGEHLLTLGSPSHVGFIDDASSLLQILLKCLKVRLKSLHGLLVLFLGPLHEIIDGHTPGLGDSTNLVLVDGDRESGNGRNESGENKFHQRCC